MNLTQLWLQSKHLAAATADRIDQMLGTEHASGDKRAERQPVPQAIPVEASAGPRRRR